MLCCVWASRQICCTFTYLFWSSLCLFWLFLVYDFVLLFYLFRRVACDARVILVFVVLPSLLVSEVRFGVLMSLGHVWEWLWVWYVILACTYHMDFFIIILLLSSLHFLLKFLLNMLVESVFRPRTLSLLILLIFASLFHHLHISPYQPYDQPLHQNMQYF